MPPFRLAPGFLLFPGATGSWCLHGPEDRLIRLREEPSRISRLAQSLVSQQAAPLPQDLCELASAFRSYGLLETLPPQPGSRLSARAVAVAGDGPAGTKVRELLAEAGAGSVTRLAEDSWPPADVDLLIVCAGWLPDSRWRELDAWCAERRMAWHRLWQEGLTVHLGPLTLPGATASYADARARRLAAADFPEELQALWRYLDEESVAPPPPPLSPAAAAMAAGALTADAVAFLEDRPAPSHGFAVEIDLSTLAVRRRPVLPVPRNALTEKIPESAG